MLKHRCLSSCMSWGCSFDHTGERMARKLWKASSCQTTSDKDPVLGSERTGETETIHRMALCPLSSSSLDQASLALNAMNATDSCLVFRLPLLSFPPTLSSNPKQYSQKSSKSEPYHCTWDHVTGFMFSSNNSPSPCPSLTDPTGAGPWPPPFPTSLLIAYKAAVTLAIFMFPGNAKQAPTVAPTLLSGCPSITSQDGSLSHIFKSSLKRHLLHDMLDSTPGNPNFSFP